MHDHVFVHSQRKHKSLGSNTYRELWCVLIRWVWVLDSLLRAAGSSSGAVSYGLCREEYCRFQRTPTSLLNRMAQVTRAEDPLSEIGYQKTDKLWLDSAASQPSRIDLHVQLQSRSGSLRSCQT